MAGTTRDQPAEALDEIRAQAPGTAEEQEASQERLIKDSETTKIPTDHDDRRDLVNHS
ncbi:hypothetical protein AB0G32_01845 [Streptomyces sp. NPDC023723]|uniref:hypothetical protein n=1 Tax=Streptomyces sp. NPDC023723 TaxID=3154323 RepID=UPI0033E4A5C7